MKKTIALFITVIMFATIFTACDDKKETETTTDAIAQITIQDEESVAKDDGTSTTVGDRTAPKVKVSNVPTTASRSKNTTTKASGNSKSTTKASTPTIPTIPTMPESSLSDIKDDESSSDSEPMSRVTNNFKFGTWSNNVFTNSWSNIRLTLPVDYYALSNQELEENFGSETTATNGCDINSANNINKIFLEDCVIVLPDGESSLEIYYDLDTETAGYTPEQYTDDDSGTYVKIGGVDYYMLSYEFAYNGTTYVYVYYLRQIENCMMVMYAEYYSTSSTDMANLLGSITTA